jgi:hypothetical protein
LPEIIEADVGTFDEPTFSTPDAAIAYAKARWNRTRRGDPAPLVGEQIVSASWCEDRLRLGLANGRALQFGIDERGVSPIVFDDVGADDELKCRAPPAEAAVIVRLAGQTFTWARAALDASLPGHELRGVQPSESSCFLYVRGIRILHISVLLDRRTGRPFLFWWPSD